MRKICCIGALLVTLLGCVTEAKTKQVEQEPKKEKKRYKITVEEMAFESEEIAKNTVGAKNDGLATVFLPIGYESSEKDYAVVYYLHGFSGSNKEFLRAKPGFETYNFKNQDKELIVVSVNGRCQNYGSFYTDSKVTGNWESYFINEVIPRVEAKYRVKKSKNSRGLAGFSMGGSCTLNIGLKRPDLFGAIYALAPGVLSNVEQLEVAVNDWKDYGDPFRKGYTSAFAEEVLDYPAFDNSDNDKELINKWMIGYGLYQEKVDHYLEGTEKLNKIMIAYDEYEHYTWISQGSQLLYEYMGEMNLPVELYNHSYGHDFNSDIVETSMLPFFGDNLE